MTRHTDPSPSLPPIPRRRSPLPQFLQNGNGNGAISWAWIGKALLGAAIGYLVLVQTQLVRDVAQVDKRVVRIEARLAIGGDRDR